jgi:hypothetical protein
MQYPSGVRLGKARRSGDEAGFDRDMIYDSVVVVKKRMDILA